MLKVEQPKTIKCPKCGKDTGLNQNGFHMVIPPDGLRCICGTIIIRGQEYRYETDPYLDTAYGRVYSGYSDSCYMPGPDEDDG